ncbi:hypothetical protein [Rhodospira trueperi]|uniref:DUF4412 domain-containing protein n=1 Tax=Rhodospira trueperi TaxID=69960 RepID=A0A1G7CTL3_9PROT|nr:hypothetical protein [Rhodospira trueperi]SDE41835.1 hypothetical protein SAMN05421720_106188 [Rhodospira trueperi]
MFRPMILALAAMLAATPALAGGIATLEASGNGRNHTMDVFWLDPGTVRIDAPVEGSYSVMRDGTFYTVSTMGGSLMVLEMDDSMRDMAEGLGQAVGAELEKHRATSVESITATGATETVAGIKGEVYEVQWTDGTGTARTDTVVLTDDPLVLELTRAMAATGAAVGEPDDPRNEALEQLGLGVLSSGSQFRIQAISGDTPPAELFELPAPPMSMQDMLRGHTTPGQQ